MTDKAQRRNELQAWRGKVTALKAVFHQPSMKQKPWTKMTGQEREAAISHSNQVRGFFHESLSNILHLNPGTALT